MALEPITPPYVSKIATDVTLDDLFETVLISGPDGDAAAGRAGQLIGYSYDGDNWTFLFGPNEQPRPLTISRQLIERFTLTRTPPARNPTTHFAS